MKISVTLSDLHDLNVDLLALAFSKSDLKKKGSESACCRRNFQQCS